MILTDLDIQWYNVVQEKYFIERDCDFNEEPLIGNSTKKKNFQCFNSEYEFIFEYDFINLFLESESPWHELFWQWMVDIKKAEKVKDGGINNGAYVLLGYASYIVSPLPQMLIGYVIEYLKSNR